MTWLGDNWQWLLLAVIAAVQVLNAATERWDAMSGPWPRRLLALLTEMSAAVTSSGHVNPWLSRVPIVGILLGRLKLPLNPYGGQPQKPVAHPVSFPPGPTLMVFALLGSLAVTDGCAGSWADNADKSIKTAAATAMGGWDTARAIYRQRCGAILVRCDRGQELSQCDEYMACLAQRRGHATAFYGVLEMCAQASDALEAYDRLADDAPARDAATLRAEVDEKRDRAAREASGFVKALEADGVTK